MNGGNDTYIRSLLELALEDLAAADRLAGGIDRPAAYHLSQCVEKLARAVVAHRTGKRLGRLHQIATIAGYLPMNDPWRDAFLDFDAVYSKASTAMRYPHESRDILNPPPRALTTDLEMARKLAHEIVGTIAPDLLP